jgi:hypothetical protein
MNHVIVNFVDYMNFIVDIDYMTLIYDLNDFSIKMLISNQID